MVNDAATNHVPRVRSFRALRPPKLHPIALPHIRIVSNSCRIMSASRPIDEFTDEWLSAYVDSELTPDERAAVEERLRTDPRLRQLLNELPPSVGGRQNAAAADVGARPALERVGRDRTEQGVPFNRRRGCPRSRRGARRVAAGAHLGVGRGRRRCGAHAHGRAGRRRSDDRPLAEGPGEKAVPEIGADAVVDGRVRTAPGDPSTPAAAPSPDRDRGQVKAVPSGGGRAAVESSAAPPRYGRRLHGNAGRRCGLRSTCSRGPGGPRSVRTNDRIDRRVRR